MADRFYYDGPLQPGEVVLSGPEAHHLGTVRRITAGDRVSLFNGDGRQYAADVVAVGKKQVVLSVTAVDGPVRELPCALEVAAAMPKGDRGDFLVEKLTELGVTRFTPLTTSRTVVVPKDARVENLRHAVVEASKQCGRNVLMRVDPVTAWAAFLTRPDLPPTRLILATGPDVVPLRTAWPGGGVALAIGPEGGWDATEVDVARAAGWTAVGLGPRVLRVETAAVAAAAWVATADQ